MMNYGNSINGSLTKEVYIIALNREKSKYGINCVTMLTMVNLKSMMRIMCRICFKALGVSYLNT